jgi:hypothetical protein
MANHHTIRIARAGTFQDTAGVYLYRNGPTPEKDLFAALSITLATHLKAEVLERAIRAGWLAVTKDGSLDCSKGARAHYEEIFGEKVIEPVGQIVAPRQVPTVYERPSLRKKYMPNSRGTREDVPEWSVRPAGFGFKSASGSSECLEKP